MVPSAYRQRQKDREFHKYFDLDKITPDNGEIRSSYDPTLTTFAQLGALRLNAKRCMISLFDKSNQYIIAEATRTLSLQSDTVHDDGDGLWLGTAVLNRNDGICRLVVDPMASLIDTVVEYGLGGAPCVIPDLNEDPRFKDVNFGPCAPYSRFYAGVPILTRAGAAIGSYCVLDDSPRDGLNPVLLQFMEHVSARIMEHLELTRTREQTRRGERMVTGLASFIAGKATTKTTHIRVDAEDDLYGYVTPSTFKKVQHTEPQHMYQQQGFTSSTSMDLNDSPSSKPNVIHNKSPEPQSHPSPSFGHVDTLKRNGKDISKDDLAVENVHQICSRAANIIRESMEVDGVIFFDASVMASVGDLQETNENSDTNDSAHTMSSGEDDRRSRIEGVSDINLGTPKDNVETTRSILAFSTMGASSVNGDHWANEDYPNLESFLGSLVKRHTKGKIFAFDDDGALNSGSSSEGSTTPGLKVPTNTKIIGRRDSLKTESDIMTNLLPDARYVAMTPLWDSHRERYFAGVLAWTTSSSRNLNVERDISYLKAFGNSIIAEIAQVDSLMANKAKSALLGSISHELRSPLHGIIGGVEILEDSVLNAFQSDVLQTIETCGKTLLDTVDHLLDFSKINNSMQNEYFRKRPRFSGKPRTSSGRQKEINELVNSRPPVNLDVLIEEVVEVVFAGHNKRVHLPDQNTSGDESSTIVATTLSNTYVSSRSSLGYAGAHPKGKVVSDITVTLNIDHNVNWVFKTQPGAWRRIVMNLFSNSLKYTDRGFIEMSLQAEHQIAVGDGERSRVIFTIADSGRGMSKKYLQDRLYKPFAQENVLDPGTGLGLSIVQQIVASLGGKISLKSIHGAGTTVRVSIPMTHGIVKSNAGDPRDFRLVKQRTYSLPTCLLMSSDSGASVTETVQLKNAVPFESRKSYLRDTLTAICRDWFGMVTQYNLGSYDENVAIYLVIETLSNSADLKSGTFWEHIPSRNSDSTVPVVVVLCRSSRSAYNLASLRKDSSRPESQRIVEYITQPCAPRKLARALSLCFERQAGFVDHKGTSEQSTPVPEFHNISEKQNEVLAIRSISGNKNDTETATETVATPGPFVSPHGLQAHQISNTGCLVQNTINRKAEPESRMQQSKSQGPFLLVDDNHINLKILIAYMTRNKYTYTTALDGLQALEAYKASPSQYQTVLMDISMPVMDGLESTRAIRTFEREQKMKPANIVILTGLVSDSVREEAIISGASVFLTKPVRLKELGEILKKME